MNRKISVIGLGYVGLPVAVAFGVSNHVIGFDISTGRIEELVSGHDHTNEVEKDELLSADILFTHNPDDIKGADFHIIVVPTPINEAKQPDLSLLLSASETVGSQLKAGDIVVYESTVYPGATEEDCIPVLERYSGLRAGHDFFVGYSPERINPGDRKHTFTNVTKIVSAQTDEVLDIVAEVYGNVVKADIHRAPTIKVAEAAKVIENTQRDLNVALMNELSLIFSQMGIDTQDVLKAAGTKWNFLPFTPGLVGGHCIGVDPYYLTYKAANVGYDPQVILAGRKINDEMGEKIASQVIKGLVQLGHNFSECTVTVLGFTFKENVPDIRNTKVIDIVRELKEYGIHVQVHDPLADAGAAEMEYGVRLMDENKLARSQAVILAVPHAVFIESGWKFILDILTGDGGLVFDVKGILDRNQMLDSIVLKRL